MAEGNLVDGVLELLLLLILSLLVGQLLRVKQVAFLQSSGASTLIGILFGRLVYLIGPLKRYELVTQLNPELLFVFLLPPIIFESGYTMDRVLVI